MRSLKNPSRVLENNLTFVRRNFARRAEAVRVRLVRRKHIEVLISKRVDVMYLFRVYHVEC